MKMKQRTKEESVRLAKYCVVGVLNTAVSFLVFFGLRYVGVQVDVANFLSYVAGILHSFVWNRLWVFEDKSRSWTRQGAIFFVGAFVCWALQWVCFRLLMLWLPEGWAYVIGMCVYPGLNFLFNRFITFRIKKD